MRHSRLLVSAGLALLVISQFTVGAAPETVKVIVDGKTVTWPSPASLVNKSITCPLEYYLADLGARILADPNGQWVQASKWGLLLVVFDGEKEGLWGGRILTLPGTPAKEGTTLYGPMRFFADLMGYKAQWDKANLTLTLTRKPFNAPKATLVLEDSSLAMGAPAYFHEGSLMAPAERFLTALGATVYWDSPTLAATGAGVVMSAISEDIPVRVTVNGATVEVKRGVGVINGLPYVPVGVFAREFGFTVRWDRATLTADITAKPKSRATELVVSDGSLVAPKLHALPDASLLVVARTPNPTPEIAFVRSTDEGETWEHLIQIAPRSMAGTMHFDGFGLPSRSMALYGTIQTAAYNITEMPVWLTDGTNGWRQATCAGGIPGTTKRTVSSVVANSDCSLIYAAGAEVTAGASHAQLWRSEDHAQTWMPLCDVNGGIIGGSATAAPPTRSGAAATLWDLISPKNEATTLDDGWRVNMNVGDIAPDNTVWGWTHEEFVRIEPNGVATTMPVFVQNFHGVVDIDAPTNNDVYVLWREGAQLDNLTWTLSISHDRGATWDKLGLQVAATFDSTDCLVDVARPDAWTLARGFMDNQAIQGWLVGFETDDDGADHDSLKLTGHIVHDLVMPNRNRAYVLSQKISPKTLYITRWDWLR